MRRPEPPPRRQDDPDHEDPFALREDRARVWCELHRVPWEEFYALARAGSLSRVTRWSKSRRAFVSRSVNGLPNVFTYWDPNRREVVTREVPAEIVYEPGWLAGAKPG